MPSLLVVVFLVELAINVVNTIGATTINNLLWALLNYLPLNRSKAATEDRKLRHEFVKVRRDLNATSSQDEFAKWAKLRRTHDKLFEQLEKNKQSMDASRSKFDTYLTGVRWLVTRVPQYLLPFWYGKQPMFWLPYGWFPYYAEWILSFPRAPMGSVSIVSWQLACTGVIALCSELVTSILGLAFTSSKTKGEPVMVPGTPAAPSKERQRVKKEL